MRPAHQTAHDIPRAPRDPVAPTECAPREPQPVERGAGSPSPLAEPRWFAVALVHVLEPPLATGEVDAIESYVVVLADGEDEAVEAADKLGREHDFRPAFDLTGADDSVRVVYRGVRCSRSFTSPEFFPHGGGDELVLWNRLLFDNMDDVWRFAAGRCVSVVNGE